MARETGATRRSLLKAGVLAPAVLIGGGVVSFATQDQKPGEEEVSTVEDLMREHGVLRRVLLVYGEAVRRIEQKVELPGAALAHAAALVRSFVEGYHEKLEEDYLFPRFRKTGKLVDLVTVLGEQHRKGRALTGDIERLATQATPDKTAERARLRRQLESFIRMYVPHAAREDTVLFPAFKKLVSPKEYDALGDEFEKKEQEMFGQEGFEKHVEEVAALEKQMGIYDLAQFTPPA
jgi:hemerythrin-like domain-containing protein